MIKWILLSVFQHYKNKVTGLPLIIPSQETPTDLSANRAELIFAGPDFDYIDGSTTRYTLRLNLLIITNKDPSNPTFHYSQLDKVSPFFSTCIPVHKYGNIPTIDDKTLFNNLVLESDIKITDIQPFDSVSRQQRSTLEGQYYLET